MVYNSVDITDTITPSGGSTDTMGNADSQGERVSQSQPAATSYANGIGIQSQTTSAGSTYFQRDPSGGLISEVTPGGEYYYFTDNIGSVLALVDTTGTQVAAYTYDPYGGHATVGAGSSPNTNIANANPYRYAGAYYDTATGLYKMGVRYYDPNLGRFTQLDPDGHLMDLRQGDRYGYAADDPTNATDPSGENILSDIGHYFTHDLPKGCIAGVNPNGSCRGSSELKSCIKGAGTGVVLGAAAGEPLVGLAQGCASNALGNFFGNETGDDGYDSDFENGDNINGGYEAIAHALEEFE